MVAQLQRSALAGRGTRLTRQDRQHQDLRASPQVAPVRGFCQRPAKGAVLSTSGERQRGVVAIVVCGRTAMKSLISVLIALSVLAGIAAPASALDGKTFWEESARQTH